MGKKKGENLSNITWVFISLGLIFISSSWILFDYFSHGNVDSDLWVGLGVGISCFSIYLSKELISRRRKKISKAGSSDV